MAGSYDICIEQGATFQRTITWKDASGDPIDLTGFSARMQVRRKVSSTETLVVATTDNGYITLGDEEGTIAIEIPADVTAELDFRTAVYDLEVESPGGIVTRLIQGSVGFSKEVTR